MPNVLEMKQERGEVAQKAREILNLAQNEKRDLFSAELREIDKYGLRGEELTKIIDAEERIAAIEERAYETHRPAVKPGMMDDTSREARDFGKHLNDGKRFTRAGDFYQAVARSAITGGRDTDVRLFETRATGASEAVGSDGGFLMQPEFSSDVFKRSYQTGQVIGDCTKMSLGPAFNSAKIPAINESSRVDGSRWGGILAYWAGEGGALTASRPKFRMMDLALHKLTALCYVTDELLQDSTLLEQVITQGFSEEIGFQLDTACIRGLGGGQPLGILNAPATVSVASASGSGVRFQAADVLSMYARMYAPSRLNSKWYINQDVEPQLYGLVLGTATVNQAVYVPPGGLSGAPYATLMGRPVIPIEQCSTLGTVGDVIFADMSQYIVIDKGGLQAASSMHVAFLTDEQVFRFTYRVDGQPRWQTALTPYKGSNTLSPFITCAVRT